MKNRVFLICSILPLFTYSVALGQGLEKENIINTIDLFFEGMKSADTSKINEQLYTSCELKTIGKTKEGNADIHYTEMPVFVEMIAKKPASQILDERISSYDIMIDQNMAIAWTPYLFYMNDTFSHCGVNVFSLIKDGEKWKIFAIMDTRQKENCLE